MYHPHISAILNLEENHLDSVQSKKKYFMDKTNIFKHCSPLDYFIYNPEIKFLKRKHIKANIRYFNPTIFYKFDFLDNVKKGKLKNIYFLNKKNLNYEEYFENNFKVNI